jgi:hypothetical protein
LSFLPRTLKKIYNKGDIVLRLLSTATAVGIIAYLSYGLAIQWGLFPEGLGWGALWGLGTAGLFAFTTK